MIETATSLPLSSPELGYLLAFAGAFLESLAFLGIFVPGTVLAGLSGFVAERWPAVFDVRGFMLLVALGAFLGDAASYLIGRYYGPPLFAERSFFLKRRYLVRAQQYFAAHGGKSVFSGHFLGPVRSVVPFVAGMAEMGAVRFVAWSAAASALWAMAYVGVGYVFGASWEAVELWGTRLTLFLLGIGVALILNWAVGRFLIRHEPRVRAVLLSLGRSAVQGLTANRYAIAFVERHARMLRFLRRRFSPYEVLGLSLTVSATVSFLILLMLLELVHEFVRGPLSGVDVRLFGVVTFVRDPLVSQGMLVVTNLAGWPILGFVAAAALLLASQRRWFRAALLCLGTAAAALLQLLTKWLFVRPRPPLDQALVDASSSSFPSGHALLAVVVYGYLVYVALGYVRSWRTKIVLVLATVFTVGLIGLSRVYLGVHWPSDVLGGYLVGAWWLVVLLTILYTRESFFTLPSGVLLPRPWAHLWHWLAAPSVVAAVGFLWLFTVQHPLRTVAAAGAAPILPRTVAAVLDEATLQRLPSATETVSGRPQAPISLVIVGTRPSLERAFSAAGWQFADPLDLRSLLATIRSTFDDQPYPTAPFGPSFYNGRVQDLGVQQGTAAASVRQRHHARFWLSALVLRDGRDVWVGTASFDRGVTYSSVLKFPTHTISPDIDRERDLIRDNLVTAGQVVRQETVQLTAPVVGTTATGAPFFTDGRAHVLWLGE